MKEESKIVRISVRNLVEFILRGGDIDSRTGGGPDRDAMLLGGRLHRKIQRRMGPEYHAEVPLKIEIPCDGFCIRVEGRADGIIIKENSDHFREREITEAGAADQKREAQVTIDEIKGVLRDLSSVEQPAAVHLAQAKCYAYIYAAQHGLSEIGVQMTYCQLETEEIRRFYFCCTIEDLAAWFGELIQSYEKWARFEIEWKKQRDESIHRTEFPFPYRAGQRDVAAAVYRTILRKKKLFIQAPTGVGKTISTVFPAVKAVGEGLGNKIFYLTAKTITRTAAEQAFQIGRAHV